MRKHLLSIKDLSKAEIMQILDTAEKYLCQSSSHSPITLQLPHSKDLFCEKWIANVFFEPSTRTRCSFEIAAKRLGTQVLTLDISSSSTQKGEDILDTFRNLEAMGCDVFVVRHPEDGMVNTIAEHLKQASVINAGDGQNEHPTQAMLDMLTIRQHKANFSELSVAIVGDVVHSRVARSNIFALQILGVNDIRVIAPPLWLPNDRDELCVKVFDNLSEGLCNVDVIITLRIQKERMLATELLDMDAFCQPYRITENALTFAKSDVIVMHPGPLNRGVEITSQVADGAHSVILQQVVNGVAVRMAVCCEALRKP